MSLIKLLKIENVNIWHSLGPKGISLGFVTDLGSMNTLTADSEVVFVYQDQSVNLKPETRKYSQANDS